jgi:hypothetical protein
MISKDVQTREIVERALDLLAGLTGSKTCAVFVCDEGREPELFVSLRIDQAVLDRVRAAWRYGCDALAYGSKVDCVEGSLLFPVIVDRRLRGLIYLEQMGNGAEEEISLVSTLIGNRLIEGAPRSLRETPNERESLLLLLERNEWNIARVSRLLGVSRLTVYRRLGRHGVSRPSGPKRHPSPLPDGTA